MIRKASFVNFKSLKAVSIELDKRLNVFVGPNSSGKSSVLEGIALCCSIPRDFTINFKEKYHHSEIVSNNPITNFSRTDMFISVTTHTNHSIAFVVENANSEDYKKVVIVDGEPCHSHADLKRKKIHPIRSAWIDPDSKIIRTPSLASTGRPSLGHDGRGLATVLQYIILQRDGVIERIDSIMQKLIPGFISTQIKPTDVSNTLYTAGPFGGSEQVRERGPGFNMFFKFKENGLVPASHVSEGTLFALCLITTLEYEKPHIVLMDDIQKGIHPAAQQEMARYLLKILDERPETQIIVTTHSPFFVDACPPETVRVFGRNKENDVCIKSLVDHPGAEEWLQTMSAGEFWASVGEDWVGHTVEEIDNA